MTENPGIAEAAARYGRIAAGFDARLKRMSEADWSAQTPCTEWDARGLVTHVLEVHRRVGAMLDGSEPAPVERGEELAAAWRAARDRVTAAMADGATAARVVDTKFFGEMPFADVVGGLLCADTLVHTWDLSRATGQDERLDPEGVAAAAAMLGGLGDKIRGPGAFGPAVDPGPDADEQTRFICYCGRAV